MSAPRIGRRPAPVVAAIAWGMGLALAALAGSPPASPEALYAERAAKLEGKKDAKAWLKLADFAEEHLLGKWREEALRKALEQAPENAEARARLDEARAGKDWLPAGEVEAKDIEENEARGLVFYGTKWVKPKEAQAEREKDRKAEGWDLDFRLDTPNLRIYSARPLAFTRRLAALLENEIAAYRRVYGKVWKLQETLVPARVYLFRDREAFERQAAPFFGQMPPLLSGFYRVKTRVLYVGCIAGEPPGASASEWELLHTAVHETVHLLDDQLARVDTPQVPLWVKEGRADHFGYAVSGRQVLPGDCRCHPKSLVPETLASALDAVPLGTLVGLDRATFLAGKESQHYFLSLAFVHFLLHAEGGRHAEGFRTYLKGLPGKGTRADLERALGLGLDPLEAPFKDYARETLIPMLKRPDPGKGLMEVSHGP